MSRSRPVAPPGTVSVWRTIVGGWYVFVPVVLGYALVQFLLVLPNATPSVSPLFLTIVAAAYVSDVALVTIVFITASARSRALPLVSALGRRPGRRLAGLVGLSAVGVAAISTAGVINAVLAGVVVLLAVSAVPPVVAGRGVRAWFRPLRWTPVRTVVWGVVAYLLLIVATLADAEFGFLVGDPAAAALARIVTGFINIYILCSASVLAERAEARRAESLRPPASAVSPEQPSPRRTATGSRRR